MKSKLLTVCLAAIASLSLFALAGCGSDKAAWYQVDRILDLDAKTLQETLTDAFSGSEMQTTMVLGEASGELMPRLTCMGNPESNPFESDCTLAIELVGDHTFNPQPNFFEEYEKEANFEGHQIYRRATLSCTVERDYSLWGGILDEVQKKCGLEDSIGEKETSESAGKGSNTVFYKTLTRYGKCQINGEDALWSIRLTVPEGSNQTSVVIKAEPLAASRFESYEQVEQTVS